MATYKSKPLKLMIVDDHEVVRIGLGAVLDLTPGIKVVGQASQKDEAKRLCLRLKPDVVLMDIRLPDGSGIDLARDILSACPDTRVLFLTSFADDHTVLEAILSGAQGYVLKDIASDALIRAIKTVAAGQPLMDPPTREIHDAVDQTNRRHYWYLQARPPVSSRTAPAAVSRGRSHQQGNRLAAQPQRKNGQELPGEHLLQAANRPTVASGGVLCRKLQGLRACRPRPLICAPERLERLNCRPRATLP